MYRTGVLLETYALDYRRQTYHSFIVGILSRFSKIQVMIFGLHAKSTEIPEVNTSLLHFV
jgi:hypothetical protein